MSGHCVGETLAWWYLLSPDMPFVELKVQESFEAGLRSRFCRTMVLVQRGRDVAVRYKYADLLPVYCRYSPLYINTGNSDVPNIWGTRSAS